MAFWNSPSLSVPDCWSIKCTIPVFSSDSRMASWSAELSLPKNPVYGWRPMPTRSRTVKPSTRANSRKRAAAIFGLSDVSIFCSGFSSHDIFPERGFCKPASVLSKVDFPAPFAPMIASTSPASSDSWKSVTRFRILPPGKTYPTVISSAIMAFIRAAFFSFRQKWGRPPPEHPWRHKRYLAEARPEDRVAGK